MILVFNTHTTLTHSLTHTHTHSHTLLRFYPTPVRTAVIKKTTHSEGWRTSVHNFLQSQNTQTVRPGSAVPGGLFTQEPPGQRVTERTACGCLLRHGHNNSDTGPPSCASKGKGKMFLQPQRRANLTSFARKWIRLERITLNKVSQPQRDKYILSFVAHRFLYS